MFNNLAVPYTVINIIGKTMDCQAISILGEVVVDLSSWFFSIVEFYSYTFYTLKVEKIIELNYIVHFLVNLVQ